MPKEVRADELDLASIIRPGDTVVFGHGSGEPRTLTELMVAQRHRIGRFRVFLGSSYSETLAPEHADAIEFIGTGAVGTHRRLAEAGVLRLMPTHLSELAGFFDSGLIRGNVVFLHLSPPGPGGEHSMGLINDYLKIAMRGAHTVIAEVNERVPWTYGDAPLDFSKVDYVVRTVREPVTHPIREPVETERVLARRVAELVPEGATIQIGIGTVPSAILDALHGHRRLGLHSGMLCDSVVGLIESGAVTNETKPFDRGISVTGALLGTRRLYDFCHLNPAVMLKPVTYTHNIAMIATIDKFFSFNSAIEVDLSGQVNAEVASGGYIGSVGGQVDYVRSAKLSRGGRSIIALAATARGGKINRVVPALSEPVVTTSRADVDVIVTEYGVAELRGQPLDERARRLIAVAAPQFRESLERAAHAAHRRG